MMGKWRGLMSDQSGKGLLKFSIGTCVIGIAVATASPAFKTNPLIDNAIMDMRHHLPAALDVAREAMGGR